MLFDNYRLFGSGVVALGKCCMGWAYLPKWLEESTILERAGESCLPKTIFPVCDKPNPATLE
jgi:hypothetical protein